MKLNLFTGEVRQQWIEHGYDSVKITASGNLSINEEPGPFFLIEPYNGLIDTGGGDLVQNIGSETVEEIIANGTGRYFQ